MQKRFQVMHKIGRPQSTDAPSWYPDFWALAPGDDLITALRQNQREVQRTLLQLKPEQLERRYAMDKWTLKQVLIHLADEERYYAYKAFCCSRAVRVFLEVPMGVTYCADFNASNRSYEDISAELIAVRASSVALFQTMSPAMLDLRDNSQPEPYTARSIGWFIAGHSNHHLKIIHEKYLTI